MKKLIIGVVFLMAFTSLDLQAIVQQKVQKHIVANVENPKAYQNISFGRVEKFMLPFQNTNVGQSYIEQAQVSLQLAKSNWQQANNPANLTRKDSLLLQVDALEKEVENFLYLYDSAAKKYKPVQYGWKIFHKYKLKDYDGNPYQNEDTFYLDKKLRVVDKDTIIGFIQKID